MLRIPCDLSGLPGIKRKLPLNGQSEEEWQDHDSELADALLEEGPSLDHAYRTRNIEHYYNKLESVVWRVLHVHAKKTRVRGQRGPPTSVLSQVLRAPTNGWPVGKRSQETS